MIAIRKTSKVIAYFIIDIININCKCNLLLLDFYKYFNLC